MGNYSPLKDDYDIMRRIIEDYSINKVIEFGPGESTHFFKSLGVEVVSYENNEKYVNINNQKGIKCRLYENIDGLGINDNDSYDLAFVDGPKGTGVLSRYNTLKYSLGKCKYVILHDSKRKGEIESIEKMKEFFNIKVTQFKTKKGICLIEKL